MKLLLPLVSLITTVFALVDTKPTDVTVSYQTISASPSKIYSLADIRYDPSTSSAEITSYEAPELPEDVEYLQMGIWDEVTSSWASSTSVTSAESFAKGYSPTIVLFISTDDEVTGVSLKSGVIDAGWTRDFGPKVKLVQATEGKRPELNKPIVVSKEGKVAEEVPEKTFLQKYWWVLLAGAFLLMGGGGGDAK